MSHIVTIETQIRDAGALRSACSRLGHAEPVHRTADLFTSKATGYCVELPDWRYPVVCDVDEGRVHFDNYEGRWGDPVHLDRLTQAYAVERAKIEARRNGHSVTEQPLNDGSIKLVIGVGGAA
jgi:hypothetical protein